MLGARRDSGESPCRPSRAVGATTGGADHGPKRRQITDSRCFRPGTIASLPIHPRLPPSLSHVVPCEAPRLFGVARRNASIACRSLLPAPFPDQGSFPTPALPGFTGTTTLSATPGGRFRASRHHRWPAPLSHPKGLPVLHTTPLSHMPSPLPRRNRWVHASFASPTTAAFPEIQAGRLPHCPFRGLLSVHCTLRPMRSLNPLRTLLHRNASTASLPPRPFRLLPAGTTLAGWDSHPLMLCTLARRTELLGLSASCAYSRPKLPLIPEEGCRPSGKKNSVSSELNSVLHNHDSISVYVV